MKNPNELLTTPFVKSDIKRWIKMGYENEYILIKLKQTHSIEITSDELNTFIYSELFE